jgi:hypothetical protein
MRAAAWISKRSSTRVRYSLCTGSWGPAFFLNSNFKYLESSPGIFHAAASVVSRHSFPVFADNTKHVEFSDGRFQHGCPFLEIPRSFRRKIPARLPVSENSTKFPTEDSSTAARFWKLEQDFS